MSCSSDAEVIEEAPEGNADLWEERIDEMLAESEDSIFVEDTLVQELPFISDEYQEAILDERVAEFVSVEQMHSIRRAMRFRDTIQTLQGLFDYYTEILPPARDALSHGMWKSHPETIYAGDSEPADDWQFISTLIPELHAACLCGECSSEAHIRIDKMLELAQLSPDTEDDRYFEFCANVYHYGWAQGEQEPAAICDNFGDGFYVHDHCCVCYYNSLGNEFHYNALFHAFQPWTLYQEKVDGIISNARFGDGYYNFYYTKEEVLEELGQIETLDKLPQEMRDGIAALRTKMDSGEGIHYGCQSGDCPTP